MTEVLTYEALKADRDALAERVERLSGMLTESRHATKAAVERADALAVENAELKSAVTAKAYIDFIKSNGWNAGAKTINGKFAGFMDPEVDFGSIIFAHAKKLIDAVETPATSAALAAIEARVWAEAKDFAKSMLASDSADCIDFLFDGKIQQLREAK